jgi:hypothetical protein
VKLSRILYAQRHATVAAETERESSIANERQALHSCVPSGPRANIRLYVRAIPAKWSDFEENSWIVKNKGVLSAGVADFKRTSVFDLRVDEGPLARSQREIWAMPS